MMTSGVEGEGLRDADPRRIGPFRILSRLGQGGMGTVFLGRDADDREAAVKVIHPHWAADPDFRRRFQREVAAAQRVARFCTAAVLGAGVDGDVAYLATEYVPGPTLQEVVRTRGPLSGSSLEAVAVNVAVALQAIHNAGVIHRDLKPSNVLLSPVGPKVIDFGIAQVTENSAEISSVIAGTPSFMSPEQANGERLTPASDIFAWGALVAYTASGRAPFGTGSIPSILYRVIHTDPDISTLEPELRAIVERALVKDPAQRPTAQQLLDLLTGRVTPDPTPDPTPAPAPAPAVAPPLDRAQAGEPAPTRMSSPGGSPRGRRPRFLTGLVAAVAAVVTAGVVITVQLASSQSSGESSGSAEKPGTAQSGEQDAAQNAQQNATGNSTEAGGGPSDSGSNPLRDPNVRLYAPVDGDAARQASAWEASGRTADAALMRKLAEVPQAVWLSQMTADEAARATGGALEAAARQGTLPVFVTDHIPLRACNENGAASPEAYLHWIDAIARAVGDRAAVFVLEPNSLAELPGSQDCARGDAKDQQARFQMLASAVDRLRALPHAAVYLDGSLEHWPSLDVIAARLIKAGIGKADGFYLNAAGFQPTDRLVAYGTRLAGCVKDTSAGRDCTDANVAAAKDTAENTEGLPHFVIDTSRNGKGEWEAPAGKYKDPQEWCNPPGRGVGVRPTTRTGSGLADGYLWLRPPGLSDDRCTRGAAGPKDPIYGIVTPHGGVWWPDLALQRARDAVPPL
ncbi:glycoside hydrolase family 6 protein [Sphaerimonospora cavernae]|uniref:Glycoside hydrolase family 6 protein n=1 Tax=Sphaerimonospora cavernae TaxID=1740611 RepID=A0ABV6UAE9_9ACTN